MKRYDVIGIGNALLDILVPVDDGLLGELGITRGAMELVTSERSDGLYRHLPEGRQRSGGSAANTIAGFAALGGSAGFIGKVGDDAFGDRFIADLQASNIAWFGKNMALQTITESERAGTGRCLVLISD
ncbi:MAG: PfkB family carbohydrate kinase, partial [Pseudomonadota bacterium]